MQLWLADVLHTLYCIAHMGQEGQYHTIVTVAGARSAPLYLDISRKQDQTGAAAATPSQKMLQSPRHSLARAAPDQRVTRDPPSCAAACSRGGASAPTASPMSLRKSPRQGAAEGASGSQGVLGAHRCRSTPVPRPSLLETLLGLQSLLHSLRAGAVSAPTSNLRAMTAPLAARLHSRRGCRGWSSMLHNSRCTEGHGLQPRLQVGRLRAQCCLCVCQLGFGKVRSLPCPV